MSALALALVLTAALTHSTWNLLAKRSGGTLAFVWLFGLASTVILLVPAIVSLVVSRPTIASAQLLFIVGSGVLHIAYFLLLQQGYAVGDLSFVYPAARGTGVLLATLGGVVVYDEHPGALAIVGAVAVTVGILALAGPPRRMLASGALLYALATGTVIATYTLWDKHAVDALAIPPLFYYWSFNLITLVGLAPLALRDRGALAREWRESRREVLGVGLLAPASYVLVLSALVFTPVSFIAGTRELGIVFGSAMGVLVLGEEGALIRITTSCVILAGVVMLAIG